MKISHTALIGSTLFLAAQAHAQMSGTSHPDTIDDNITVSNPQAPPAPVPVQRTAVQAQQEEVYKPYAPAGQRPVESRPLALAANPDDGIVTSYEYSANAVSAGTLIRARLVHTLSTEKTHAGEHFVALLSQPIEHNGRILIPQGSTLEGRVTKVKSGSRISGGAAMHLEPENITLPDGTLFHLSARVTDVDWGHGSHVNEEGTIVGGNHVKGHAVTLAATTGGGAITGAVLGGGVGAAVGAGIGAGVGTVLWLKQDREQTLPDGTEIIFSLNRPMALRPSNGPATGR